MKKFCWLLIVLAIIVVSLGFYRGWFTVSGGREAESHKVDVNLKVDPDKVKEDAETVKEKVTELTGKTKEGDTDVGDQAKDNDNVKPKPE